MAELKKCPFCGGKILMYVETVDAESESYHFRCCDCYSDTYFDFCDREEAIEAWNNRATEAEIRATAEHTYENCHNITCRRKCRKDGYNMAIDEFAEKLGRLCENSAMALDRYNGRPLYNKDGKWHDLITDVAEQLKERE